MNLLVVTQAVDRKHPVLGFFHEWIAEFSTHFEQIEVICLYAGDIALPENVRVHSLRKENQESVGGRASFLMRMKYAARFLRLAWRLRARHDAAFVHMNQEYVLLAGWLWRLSGKRIYMWRNHYAGSLLTGIASAFCTKVFCTSRFSYTAKYRKTVFMPVGVDAKRFYPDPQAPRTPRSILFLARMAPSKDPLMLLDALRVLKEKGTAFTATFAGSPLPEHESYYRDLIVRSEEYGLAEFVAFAPAVTHEEAPGLYRSHEIFVNCSPSGMFDKTLFEAAACGCLVLARSEDFSELAGSGTRFAGAQELAANLEAKLTLDPAQKKAAVADLERVASGNSLEAVAREVARILRAQH